MTTLLTSNTVLLAGRRHLHSYISSLKLQEFNPPKKHMLFGIHYFLPYPGPKGRMTEYITVQVYLDQVAAQQW